MTGPRFSPRQVQVLRLIILGKSSKQIARELGVTFKTVTSHRAAILAKTEVCSVASAWGCATGGSA